MSGINHFWAGQRVTVKVGDKWRGGEVLSAPPNGSLVVAVGDLTMHISKMLVPKMVRAVALVGAAS
jgi:hypothetical protein